MIGTLERDDKQNIISSLSAYQPSDAVRVLTSNIQRDFQIASDLQERPFTEFNDYSLRQRMDLDQKRWNAYREPKSSDPDEAWRWNGIRPITRNKIIAIVAQMTAKTVIPAPSAQNDKDEEDRMAAEVMRDLLEYDIRNSSYVSDYIEWVTSALVNPAAFMSVGFVEAMQTIREVNGGKVSKKDVIDGVLSGFQTYNVPTDEVLVGNFYQKDIERQRFLVRRRFIEFDEARGLWGEHKNFEYVKPGLIAIFNGDNQLFYNVFDQTMRTLVEEVTYYNRLEDIEIPFVNGIYMGEDDTEANLIKHRNNENCPQYNLAVLGFENISPRFFYFKSAAWKLGDDDELVQRMEQLTVDATFLSVMPPQVLTGQSLITEAVIIPGKTTTIESPEARIQPIQLGSAISAGWQAIGQTVSSISDSSISPILEGKGAGVRLTAREAVMMEENAKVTLGLFGSMIGNSVKRLGNLMMDVILQHQTVADVEETADGNTVEKWKNFILPDVQMGGKKVTKKIIFNPNLMGTTMDDNSMNSKAHQMLEQEGGIDSKMRLYEVNPEAWRKLKFQIVIDTDTLTPKNSIFEKSLKQDAYAKMTANPMSAQFLDMEAITRDFLVEPYAEGETDKYMRKTPIQPQPAQPGQPTGPGPIGGMMNKLTGSNV